MATEDLPESAGAITISAKSTHDLLHEIETLPKADQLWLIEELGERTEAEIPESFLRIMAEAERGELIELDEALRELERP